MRAERSPPPLQTPASLALLSSLTGTAMRGFGDLLGWQSQIANQMLVSMHLQQQAKAAAFEEWLNQRSVLLQNNLEESVHVSKDLYVATSHAQANWLQASEHLMAEANRNLLQTIKHMSPCGSLPAAALQPVCSAMKVGSCAVESMTKATRQVTNFASTNLGNAAVNAVRAAREEMNAGHTNVTRHH